MSAPSVLRRPPMLESEFQSAVVELARMLGWRCCHTRRTIGKGHSWTTATSIVGWPDLVLYHPARGGLLFRELKTDTGVVSNDQRQVLAELTAAGADVGVWRPVDLDSGRIRSELLRRKPRLYDVKESA